MLRFAYWNTAWVHWPPTKQLLIAAGVLFTSIINYHCLEAIMVPHGVNWSVEKAVKWCSNPAWVHSTTKPLTTMNRTCGLAMGLALSRHKTSCRFKKVQILLGLVVAFVYTKVYFFINDPHFLGMIQGYDLIQYVLQYCSSVLYIVTVTWGIPSCLNFVL